MHDRARAISLLQQARDILAERLTERILESRDAILEDALGLAYSSEIDAIQEQIGQRLNHVNLMLNNLPPMEEAPPPRAGRHRAVRARAGVGIRAERKHEKPRAVRRPRRPRCRRRR